MLDVNKCQEILEHHFATVTREEFLSNLEEFCPEFIAAGIEDSELDKVENTEIYQQAKQESKLEIAPKLLKKGLSIQEVAEILELDVHLLTK
jgi:predicted transposase/invertase (TIGR01784 family)